MDRVLVCHYCKDKILAVQRQTNQSWIRCVEALQESDLHTNKAVNSLYGKREIKMNVVAKFTCTSKRQYKNYNQEPKFLYEYLFQPVTGGSKENEEFFASTPGGQLSMSAVRDDLFEPGKSYYLRFEEAE